MIVDNVLAPIQVELVDQRTLEGLFAEMLEHWETELFYDALYGL